MSAGNSSKPRKGSRVGEVFLQPNRISVAMEMLKRADVMLRIGLCVIAGLLFWFITTGWERPFPFREGQIPERAVAARVPFSTVNVSETEKKREASRRQVVTIYTHDQGRINQLRLQLIEEVTQLRNVESFAALQEDKNTAGLWNDFMSGIEKPNSTNTNKENIPEVEATTVQSIDAEGPPARKDLEQAQFFNEFKESLATDENLEQFKKDLATAMRHIDENGLLKGLKHEFDKEGGNQLQIRVVVNDEAPKLITVEQVRIENSLKELKANLEEAMAKPVAGHIYAWFAVKDRLKETLTYDRKATEKQAEAVAAAIPDVPLNYPVDAKLAAGGEPLTAESIFLLKKEHEEMSRQMSVAKKLSLTLSHYGMYAAIFSLCGFYSVFRRREVLTNKHSLIRVLCLSVVTLVLCRFAATDFSETVLIPLLLFSMAIVVAYDQEVALLLSTVMALIVVVSLGFGMEEFAIYVAGMATAVLCLRHVRSRTKLIYVGLTTAAIAAATAIGAATLNDPMQGYNILVSAAWYGFFSVVAGLLMTGLLPFIESLFDIQTELSLLELSDVSHPLLQELVRRAPGTYHHTMNVASIAEAAAEAIDANGLLVRVGAYFHDIGKMLKPGYFIENQGDGGNRHESLLPAMSTLVIIAHVKDGADLARQHNLPNSLVDFIMQHHVTTLVEYFYRRASEESKADPDSGEVDEHSYRYPGPKPQTKEAAVLMLADTVESACRSLTDPTPSRIENLVHELAMKKLLDGQFDECGLTLSERKRMEVSLIKSLAAVYHARIKYPDQKSA